MAKLFTIDNKGKLAKTEERPFSYETDDMEKFIKKNPQILGEIIIFSEQIISPRRDKITDLLGVNKDGEIVIIELKKDIADINSLSQILKYKAEWKRNLEGIRNLWNEFGDKPEDIKPDWNNYDPKMMIVAPSFDTELIETVTTNNLSIDFIQIARYSYSDFIFVVIDRIEKNIGAVSPITSQKEYDWNWYLSENIIKNDKHLELVKFVYDQVIEMSKNKSWTLSPKFNKWYIAFKYGYNNVVWFEFRHNKVLLSVNLTEENDNPSSRSNVKWNWNKHWSYWYTEIESKSFDIKTIENILEEAYKNTVAV